MNKNKNIVSFISFVICIIFLLSAMFYNPRWKKSGVHATISWDVSGYYIYLPALFIYKDIKKVSFKNDIHNQYQNSSHPYQTRTYKNGNEVAKYSCGLALQYLPFFLIADNLAKPLGYKRDGYSLPYQVAIHWGSLLIAIIGLYFARKNLLEYFYDKVVAITLLLLTLGTNYLNYASIDSPMTHNYLFFIYSVLIWTSIQFYKNPTWKKSIIIGLLVGLAALTRPTEIMIVLIPVFWGLPILSSSSIKDFCIHILDVIKKRILFLLKHYPKIVLSVIITVIIGSLQLIYWKYVGGSFLIYSYEEDQFLQWWNPFLKKGLFSFQKGWLIYTPLMFFALIGIGMMLFKKHSLAFIVSVYSFLFIYVTFSWNIWWYGGSLGQRPMVQAYALLIFPLAFFIQWVIQNKKRAIPFAIISSIFIYYNIWLHHQAHEGKMLDPSYMTKAYFWRILGKWEQDKNDLKLLDTHEYFKGKRKNINRIYFNNFEKDTIIQNCDNIKIINGKNSFCIEAKKNEVGKFEIPLNATKGKWIRVGGQFRIINKEWNLWSIPKIIIRFHSENKILKQNYIRLHRLLDYNSTQEIFFDTEFPQQNFDKIDVLFWTGNTKYPTLLDDLYIEIFE